MLTAIQEIYIPDKKSEICGNILRALPDWFSFEAPIIDTTMTCIIKWIPITELNSINIVPRISESLIKYIETGEFKPSFWAECEHTADAETHGM